MGRYYQVNLPKSLEKEIETLFKDKKALANLYDNNKVQFIRDATRKLILFYRRDIERYC